VKVAVHGKAVQIWYDYGPLLTGKRSAANGNVHMKNWPDKLRLLTILATTKVLLSRSGSEGWGLEYPKEAEQQIDQILDCLFFGSEKPLPHHWQVLYAPTGPLQEISMSNGWSDAYLKLSKEFDSLAHIVKKHESQAEQAPGADRR
jgi:hypothetical protein